MDTKSTKRLSFVNLDVRCDHPPTLVSGTKFKSSGKPVLAYKQTLGALVFYNVSLLRT